MDLSLQSSRVDASRRSCLRDAGVSGQRAFVGGFGNEEEGGNQDEARETRVHLFCVGQGLEREKPYEIGLTLYQFLQPTEAAMFEAKIVRTHPTMVWNED